MFNKTTFGGGFGQQPQQTNSLFGQPQQQPQQQQQTTFGGFGTTTPATTGFGAAAQNTTSAFGQPAQQTSAFGQPSTGGFGATANTGSAFGQQQPSAFGASTTSAFGSNTSTGFGGGGFGSNANNTTSAFGNTTNQAASGGLFGQRSTSTGFGQPSTTNTTFGQPQTSTFGNASTSAFGQPAGGAAGAGQGTGAVDFAPTQDRDVTTGINNFFQSITAMPQYKQYSIEELRLQDYNQNRKTGNAQGTTATGGFGSTAATGGFGSTSGTTGGFGQSNTGGFGQQPSTGAFGQTTTGGFGAQTSNTGGGLFGQTQNTGTTGFGQQPTTTGFGQTNTGGFGANTGGFGNTATTGFGAGANTAQKTFGFGATSQPATGFGSTTATTGGFGQNTLGTTGFGQTNQQTQQTGFGFGQKPAGTTTTGFGAPATGFGATTGGFGAASKPASSFSFNPTSTAPTTTQTTGFGSGFGTATSGATTGFGATQPAQTGFGAPAAGGGLFGAKPAGQTNTLFNTTTPQATTGTTGFGGFGATAQPATATTGFGAPAAGGGLFGQKPATGGLGSTGFGFGNTQQATGTTGFGFGNTQQAGTGSFTLPATGGLTSFGTSGLQPGQQPLVATVDKNPYGVNPLFDTSKLQQGVSTTVTTNINQSGITTQVKTGPTAVPMDGKRVDTLPHYPVSPRVVSKIKLRGFSFNPANKTSTKKAIKFEGISDDNILGAAAFTPRSENSKLVFDKINSNKITELVNDDQHKKKDTSLTILDPLREQLATNAFDKASTNNNNISSSGSGSRSIENDHHIRNENVDAKTVEIAIENGYYCSPTLDVLKAMTKDELKKVDAFIVGRRGYGEVKFEQPVDLSELNLNEIMGGIVVFQHKTITIYPNARTKPPVGSGLNNTATVTLENCYAIHPQTKEPIKDPNHPRFITFIEKLRKSGGENVKYINYDKENGSWVFQTKSF